MSTYMALDERWKYVYSAPDNREFLFDRVEDPRESRSRASIMQFAEVSGRLKARLMEHLRAGGETAGLDGDDWKVFPAPKVDENPDAAAFINQAEPDLAEFLPDPYID